MSAPRGLLLAREHVRQMIDHVARAYPLEACGLVAGQDGRSTRVYPIPNVAARPDRYRMDPQAQWQAFRDLEAQGWDLVAIYHSHPGGKPYPSPRDLAEATYPVVYLIWAPVGNTWVVRGYMLHQGRPQPVPVRWQ
ncbi:MAG: M67 family metallopeptidase [Chloroflexi bacterium]|nr:M67 family metallopeptidase [Chloroflexota bacterium]